jgi:hypothetical protein
MNTEQEKHTPEPWSATGHKGIYNSPDICDSRGDCIALMDSRGALAGNEEIKANAARIVACVNACASIPNPAETIAKMVEALRKIAEYGEDTVDRRLATGALAGVRK